MSEGAYSQMKAAEILVNKVIIQFDNATMKDKQVTQ